MYNNLVTSIRLKMVFYGPMFLANGNVFNPMQNHCWNNYVLNPSSLTSQQPTKTPAFHQMSHLLSNDGKANVQVNVVKS